MLSSREGGDNLLTLHRLPVAVGVGLPAALPNRFYETELSPRTGIPHLLWSAHFAGLRLQTLGKANTPEHIQFHLAGRFDYKDTWEWRSSICEQLLHLDMSCHWTCSASCRFFDSSESILSSCESRYCPTRLDIDTHCIIALDRHFMIRQQCTRLAALFSHQQMTQQYGS